MNTIHDVAKVAGVSVATVSRVLNGGVVSDKTKAKVLKAINDMNYKPNLLGRNLRRSSTMTIIILLPTISNSFYSKIVRGIEDKASENGYNVMICDTNSKAEKEKVYLEMLKNKLVDGVIIMSSAIGAQQLTKLANNFPIVQCCESKEGTDITTITIDNYSASYKAVKHLINIGNKRIALICGSNEFYSSKLREQGYRKALIDSGIEIDETIIKAGNYSFESGFRITRELLLQVNRPTAIFAMSDTMAIGAIKACREKGLSVPHDMSIVGFDNIKFATMCEPTLTTIKQPQYELGSIAMETLISKIKNDNIKVDNIVLDHELIIRDSTIL